MPMIRRMLEGVIVMASAWRSSSDIAPVLWSHCSDAHCDRFAWATPGPSWPLSWRRQDGSPGSAGLRRNLA